MITTQQLKKLIKFSWNIPASFRSITIPPNSTYRSSIQYYSTPRKVLTYPLTIGSRWIELTTPFFRERFIDKQQTISTNGKN